MWTGCVLSVEATDALASQWIISIIFLPYKTRHEDHYLKINLLNPWRYSPKEPRPTEAVAARWQYRGPCG